MNEGIAHQNVKQQLEEDKRKQLEDSRIQEDKRKQLEEKEEKRKQQFEHKQINRPTELGTTAEPIITGQPWHDLHAKRSESFVCEHRQKTSSMFTPRGFYIRNTTAHTILVTLVHLTPVAWIHVLPHDTLHLHCVEFWYTISIQNCDVGHKPTVPTKLGVAIDLGLYTLSAGIALSTCGQSLGLNALCKGVSTSVFAIPKIGRLTIQAHKTAHLLSIAVPEIAMRTSNAAARAHTTAQRINHLMGLFPGIVDRGAYADGKVVVVSKDSNSEFKIDYELK